MDVFKKLQQNKVIVEPGEEDLHKIYSFKNQSGRAVKVLVGADGGSTQTRVTVLDLNELDQLGDALAKTYMIPSLSSTVPDNRDLPSQTPNLYDNMDATLVNLSTDQLALVRNARLIRGSKQFNAELNENRLGSSTQKTDDVTYYYNLLDALGYATLLKYGNEVPSTVDVWLSASLPPDDINKVNAAKFRRNLQSFKWTHKSGVEVTFTFREIHMMTEPEAFIKAYYALATEQETPARVLHLEGGGRSTGVEILVNGKSLDSAQASMDFGGTQLLTMISELFVEENGGSPLRRSVLEEAVRTGLIRNGNSSIDSVKTITAAKKQIAEKIYTEVMQKVFDVQTRVAPRDLNVISVSGRLFDGGEYGVSVATFLKEQFHKLTPNTEFLHIEGNFIPAGLLLEGFLEFFSDQLDKLDDGTAETAAAQEDQPQSAEADSSAVSAVSEESSVSTEPSNGGNVVN